MTNYIPGPDLQMLPLPYVIERSRIAALALRTGAGAIQKLLDSTLNLAATPEGQPLVQRFKPLFGLDMAMLTFIHYPNVHSAQSAVPEEERWGFFNYEEFAVFLLLEDTQSGGLGSCWHVPFILLNKCIPLILGREVYGMPKMAGAFDVQPLLRDDWLVGKDLGKLCVGAEGFAERGAANGVRTVPVVEVDLVGGLPSVFLTVMANTVPAQFAKFLASLVPPEEFDLDAFKLLKTFFGELLPGIFLKQLAGGTGLGTPAYQRLLRADFTPTAVHSLSYLMANTTLFDPASYPIASTLGVTPGQACGVSGLFVDLDWVLPPPVEL